MSTLTKDDLFEALIDPYCVAELREFLAIKPDAGGCKLWNVTPEQWRATIEEAILLKAGVAVAKS